MTDEVLAFEEVWEKKAVRPLERLSSPLQNYCFGCFPEPVNSFADWYSYLALIDPLA